MLEWGQFQHKLLSRKDVCGLNPHLTRSKCMDAVLERLAQILYAAFMHHSFSVPACRLFVDRGVRAKQANLLM
eukprot:6049824-Amphidinium_carterae.1